MGPDKGRLGPVFSAGLFGPDGSAAPGVRAAGRTASGEEHHYLFHRWRLASGAWSPRSVHDVNALLAIRFLTGLGLGGAMPNAIANHVGIQSAPAAAPPW